MIRRRSFGAYLILSIITCGIYSIFFWYSFTEDVNRMCAGDGEDSPNYIVVLLLSIITCGIYGLYWFYKQANRMRNAAPRYGVSITEGGGDFLIWYLVGIVFCFVGSLISYHIIIKNCNILADGYNRGFYNPGGGNGGQYGGAQSGNEGRYGGSQKAEDPFSETADTIRKTATGFAQSDLGKKLLSSELPAAAAAAAVAVMAAVATLYNLFTHPFFRGFSLGNAFATFVTYFLPMMLLLGMAFFAWQKDREYKRYIPVLAAAHYLLIAFVYTGIPAALEYGHLSFFGEYWRYLGFFGAMEHRVVIAAAAVAAIFLILGFVAEEENRKVILTAALVVFFVLAVYNIFHAAGILLTIFRWGYFSFSGLCGAVFEAVQTVPWILYFLFKYRKVEKKDEF